MIITHRYGTLEEWNSLTEEEQRDWIEEAEEIKKDYDNVNEGNEIDFKTLRDMVASGL